VSTDDCDHPDHELLPVLRDNQADPTVVDGLRFVNALDEIRDPSDRRILIGLAERFAK
jgi:hypothetical protein